MANNAILDEAKSLVTSSKDAVVEAAEDLSTTSTAAEDTAQHEAIDRASSGVASRGLRSGGNQVGTMLNQLLGQTGLTLGLTDFAADRFADAEDFTRQADAIRPEGMDTGSVKNFSDLVNFITAHATSAIATSAPVLAASFALKRPVFGTFLGAGALETGEQVGTLRENIEGKKLSPGRLLAHAAGKGAVGGALELGGATGQVARSVARASKAATRGGLRRAAKEAPRELAKNIAGESVTEGLQDITGQVGEKIVDPSKLIDPSQAIESAAAGAAGGLGIGGIGQVAKLSASALRESVSEDKVPLGEEDLPKGIDDLNTEQDIAAALEQGDISTDRILREASQRPENAEFADFETNPETRAGFISSLRRRHFGGKVSDTAGILSKAANVVSEDTDRTPIDEDVHKTMMKFLPDEFAKNADPEDLLTLSQSVRKLLQEPASFRRSATIRALKKSLGDKYTDFLNEAVADVYSSPEGQRQAKQAIEAATGKFEGVSKARQTRINSIVRNSLLPNINADPSLKKVIDDELVPRIMNFIETKGELSTEFVAAMHDAFGEKTDFVLDQLDALRTESPAAVLEGQEKAPLPFEDDPRINKEFRSRKEAEEAIEGLRADFGRDQAHFSVVAGLEGGFSITAEGPDSFTLDAGEFQDVREPAEFGDTTPEEGIFTIKRAGGKQNKINAFRLTRLMMRREKQQTREGGTLKFVSDMFSRGLSALMNMPDFKGLKVPDLPDNLLVAQVGGRRITFGMLRGAEFAQAPTALKLRRAVRAEEKGTEARAKALKNLGTFFQATKADEDFAQPMVEDALNAIAEGDTLEEALTPLRDLKAQFPDTTSVGRRLQRAIDFVEQQDAFQNEREAEQEERETLGATLRPEEPTTPRKPEQAPSRRERPAPLTKAQAARVQELLDALKEKGVNNILPEAEASKSILEHGFKSVANSLAERGSRENRLASQLARAKQNEIKADMRKMAGPESKRAQGIVDEWKKLFKIPNDVMVFTASEIEDSVFMTLEQVNKPGQEGANVIRNLLASSLMALLVVAEGAHIAVSDQWSVIVMPDFTWHANAVAAGQTLAHEFGHAFHRQIFPTLTKEIQLQLASQFGKWANRRAGKTAAFKVAFRHPAAFIEPVLGEQNLNDIGLGTIDGWYTEFGEWFAEQTSKVILENPKTLSPLEKVFHEFADRLKVMMEVVMRALGTIVGAEKAVAADPAKPDPVFKAFVKGYITGDFTQFLSREPDIVDKVRGALELRADTSRIGKVFSKREGAQDIDEFGNALITGRGPFQAMLNEIQGGARDSLSRLRALVDNPAVQQRIDALQRAPLKKLAQERLDQIRSLVAPRDPDAAVEPFEPSDQEVELEKEHQKELSDLADLAGPLNEKLSKMNLGTKPITPALEKEVRAYVTRVLGPEAKVYFEKMEDAGSFADLSGVETLKIAVDAMDPRSVGAHEAMHAFMQRLAKADKKAARVLTNAANSPQAIARLKELLKGHPEALKQLDDPMERAAYMYQFWATGAKGLLPTGPETQTWFKRVRAFFRKVAAVWTDNAQLLNDFKAGEIVEAFHNGEFANKNAVAQVLADQKSLAGRETVDKMWPQLGSFIDKFAFTAVGAVKDFDIAPMTEIMDAMYIRPGTEGKEPGFLQSKHVVYNQMLNRVAAVVQKMTKEQQQDILAKLRAGDNTRGDVQVIRKVLDDAFEYLEKTGVKTIVREDGKVKRNEKGNPVYKALQRVKNYVPRVFNLENLRNSRQAFLDLLEKYEIKNGEAIYNNIVSDINMQDNSQGDETLNLTLFAPFTNERTLGSIPDTELAPFLENDLFGIMSQYLARAARRGEYTKRFDNSGEKIDEAVTEALKAGATSAQMKTFTDAVKAMDGTLGADMSQGLRAAFGAVTTYQNVRLLPFALFSSLVDAGGIVVRGGEMKEGAQAFFRGLKELFTTDIDHKYNVARAVGAINIAGDVQVVSDMYSSQFMSPTLKKLNELFFKYNGMEAWNRSMRTSAAAAAENFILRHKFEATEHSARFLRELNLSPGDVKFNTDGVGLELNDKTIAAINLWVDQAILRPNAALRPIYMSDPNWILVSHLKQYTYLFQQVIVNRVANELSHGNYSPAYGLMSYLPVIMMADMSRALLTPTSGDDHDDWDFGDWLTRGVQRAGYFGPGQMALDAGQDLRYSNPVTSLFGPTAEQLWDFVRSVSTGTGLTSDIAKAIPGIRYL